MIKATCGRKQGLQEYKSSSWWVGTAAGSMVAGAGSQELTLRTSSMKQREQQQVEQDFELSELTPRDVLSPASLPYNRPPPPQTVPPAGTKPSKTGV